MNFADAITAHLDWVNRFQVAIAEENPELLDAETIALDNVCALGKWLYSELGYYSDHPSYIRLKVRHADFHLQASLIAHLINDRHPDAAQIMLSSTGAFFRASREVILSIEQFRKEVDGVTPSVALNPLGK